MMMMITERCIDVLADSSKSVLYVCYLVNLLKNVRRIWDWLVVGVKKPKQNNTYEKILMKLCLLYNSVKLLYRLVRTSKCHS